MLRLAPFAPIEIIPHPVSPRLSLAMLYARVNTLLKELLDQLLLDDTQLTAELAAEFVLR